MRTALVLGATGLVGAHLVERLLDDPGYGSVRTLVRRPLPRVAPGLEQRAVDFDRLADHAPLFAVDDLFCALGTTIRRAGSQEAFRRVDLELVVEAAILASEQGASQLLVVSAAGADAHSRVFYNRVKGEMEAAVKRLPFQAVWIFRPSLLLGEREEFRLGERLASWAMRPLAPLMVGPLRRYRPVQAREVAAAMVRAATSDGTGGVVESEEIPGIALGRTPPARDGLP